MSKEYQNKLHKSDFTFHVLGEKQKKCIVSWYSHFSLMPDRQTARGNDSIYSRFPVIYLHAAEKLRSREIRKVDNRDRISVTIPISKFF